MVKIRLQSQGSVTEPCCMNLKHCTHVPYWNGLMDHMVLKEKCVRPTYVPLKGNFDAFRHIVRNDGVRALWSGLPPTLLLAVPSTVLYFTSYDVLIDYFKQGKCGVLDSLQPMVAGSVARSLAATLVCPLELIRTRMQSSVNHRGTIKMIREAVKHEGICSLWRGLSATLYRDVPFSAIYWTLLESFKVYHREKYSSTQATFLSGAYAGAIAATCTHPFDVLKTKLQVARYSRNTPVHSISIRSILEKEGVSTLFVGLTPRVLKIAPACAIMIASYEYGKEAFAAKI